MITTIEAASLLLQARAEHKRISVLPEACRPKEQTDAYQCQKVLVDQLIKTYGGQTVGYKIGCTNKTAQQLVNVDGPFYGQLLSPWVHRSPATVKAGDFFMRVIEPEFAFQMAYDLPSRDKEYTKEEVSRAVDSLLPAIEIVDSRFDDWTTVGGLSLIADNGCNAGWVYGQPRKNWLDFDLSKHEVELYVNGSAIRKGRGDNVMDHPLNVLIWLANTLSQHGKGLKAGNFISTGITCEVYLAQQGDQILADFGPIGSVELSFN